jgi:hypothetical protein
MSVARGAARCALHVHGRGARADACGRSFAVLSTQVSTAGFRLKQRKLYESKPKRNTKKNVTRTPQELSKGKASPLRFEFSYE